MICEQDTIHHDKTTFGSTLDELRDEEVWKSFIDKKARTPCSAGKMKHYIRLSESEGCRAVARAISTGTHRFSVPEKKLVKKDESGKMRTVYTFEEEEMMCLRIVAQLLYRYDNLFSDNLYSFRSGHGVRDAIDRLRFTPGIETMHGYKTDIHDYFNSIDETMLLMGLERSLGDQKLYRMLEGILGNRTVRFNGEYIEEKKGVMAGTPISPFLANCYLRDVDMHFAQKDCVYMRYADDILLMARTEEELMELRGELCQMVAAKGLEMNPKKESFIGPGEKFDFLGFSVEKDRVGIASKTVAKKKRQIRNRARAFRRWMLRKNAPVNGTLKAFFGYYNRKFYGDDCSEMTWCRWFFPVVTTSDDLHEIDLYMQECTRYIATGRHNKANYEAMPYEFMRELGFRPLVSEYYASIEGSANNG